MIAYINNLFKEEEIFDIFCCIEKSNKSDDVVLGRQLKEVNNLPLNIKKKLENLGSQLSKKNLRFSYCSHAIYSNKFGEPNLPPHIDADYNDLIFNYQIRSNTSWDVGLGVKNYKIKDNSCLVFDPNAEIHWRPYKNFNDGEYVEMVFFRLVDFNSPTDRSNMIYLQNDPMFREALDFRSSLSDEADN
jgi:hypothetical protein